MELTGLFSVTLGARPVVPVSLQPVAKKLPSLPFNSWFTKPDTAQLHRTSHMIADQN